MINGSSVLEPGGSEPVEQRTEPESLDTVADLLEELGPDKLDALKKIELAERALRVSSFADPSRLLHALDHAEQLAKIRNILTRLLEFVPTPAGSAVESMTTARTIGSSALDHFPRQEEKRSDQTA